MSEPSPVDLDHHLALDLTARSVEPITLDALITATSTALSSGVPVTARVVIEDRGRTDHPRRVHYDWTAPAAPELARTWRDRAHAVLDAVLVLPWINR